MAANAGANNCSPTSSAAARQLSRSKMIALVIGLWRWISKNLSQDDKSNGAKQSKRASQMTRKPRAQRVSPQFQFHEPLIWRFTIKG
jgi:hypothetical protein